MEKVKWLIKEKKTDVLAFVVSAIVFLAIDVSGVQAYFFISGEIINKLVVKIFQLVFLFVLFRAMFGMWDNRKTKCGKHGLVISAGYMLLVGGLQMIVWPGLWSQDDLGLLTTAQYYELGSRQHWLSQLFANVCLQTIPFAGGMILLQILIVALVAGWCVSKVAFSIVPEEKYKKVWITELFLLIPAFLPPVLEYILTGFRMGVYTFVELLLLVKLFLLYRENRKLYVTEMIELILLTAIVGAWRSEAIYYIVCVPILLWLLGKDKVGRTKVMLVFALSSIMVFGIGKIDKQLWGTGTTYSLTATLLALPDVVLAADEVEDANLLETLNKVVDLDYIYAMPECTGEDLFFEDGFVRNHTPEEFADYVKAYITLVFKYKDASFSRMGRVFFASLGLRGYDGFTSQRTIMNSTATTLTLLDESTYNGWYWACIGGIFDEALFPELRNDAIRGVACVDVDGRTTPMYKVFWNMLIPICLAIVMVVVFLIKKNWFMSFLVLTTLGRVPLIFITAPAPYAMYYLSVYLLGYFIFIASVSYCVVNKHKKEF